MYKLISVEIQQIDRFRLCVDQLLLPEKDLHGFHYKDIETVFLSRLGNGLGYKNLDNQSLRLSCRKLTLGGDGFIEPLENQYCESLVNYFSQINDSPESFYIKCDGSTFGHHVYENQHSHTIGGRLSTGMIAQIGTIFGKSKKSSIKRIEVDQYAEKRFKLISKKRYIFSSVPNVDVYCIFLTYPREHVSLPLSLPSKKLIQINAEAIPKEKRNEKNYFYVDPSDLSLKKNAQLGTYEIFSLHRHFNHKNYLEVSFSSDEFDNNFVSVCEDGTVRANSKLCGLKEVFKLIPSIPSNGRDIDQNNDYRIQDFWGRSLVFQASEGSPAIVRKEGRNVNTMFKIVDDPRLR